MTRLPLLTFFITLCLTVWAGALELTSGPEVELKGTTAVIRWTTDTECGTVLKYGLDPNHLNRRAEGVVGVQHEVTLKVALPRSPPSAKPASEPKSSKESKPAPEPRAAPAPAVEPARKAPPARVTWGDYSSLQDHYARHGRDFGSTSAAHYAQQAWEFLQRAMDEGLPAKVDQQGVIRVYEARTKSFASYNQDGTTRTFFKPQRPDYFRDQPGKPIRLRHPARP